METKLNVLSNSEKEIEVTLTYDEILPEIEEAYTQERKKIEMPGFRKGKVPMAMIKKMYGESIEYGASEKIAQDKFWDIADEQELKPISRPSITDIKLEPGKSLTFKVRFEVMPELELKDYKDQEVKKIVFPLKDETIEEEIEQIRLANATREDTETVEDKNSVINVDIQRVDEQGNQMEGAGSKGLDIVLSEQRVNPQIVENALGKKAGDKFTFTFHDHHETEDENGEKKVEHADYSYEATINSVKKIVLPELDEALVKKVTKNRLSTPEEFKEDIRKGISDYFTRQSESIFENTLLDMVVKNNDFEPPHGYVHFLLDRMIQYEQEKTKKEGNKRFDAHEAHHRLHDKAEMSAKWQIIMENIANKEAITVTDDDLKELAEKEAAETGITADKLLKYYESTNKKETLLEDKVIDFLKKNNNIKEVNPEDEVSSKEDQE